MSLVNTLYLRELEDEGEVNEQWSLRFSIRGTCVYIHLIYMYYTVCVWCDLDYKHARWQNGGRKTERNIILSIRNENRENVSGNENIRFYSIMQKFLCFYYNQTHKSWSYATFSFVYFRRFWVLTSKNEKARELHRIQNRYFGKSKTFA